MSRKLLFSALILLSVFLSAQTPDDAPPELRAADPQVRSMFDSANRHAEEGDYPEAFRELRKALDFAEKRKLLADQAILEATTGSVYVLEGKLPEAKQSFLNGYNNAVKTGNIVLQADITVALAGLALAADRRGEAAELMTQAVTLARKSKSLYIQSRALGELGNLQLQSGQLKEARASVEEALQLDRLNHYSWEASHLLYLAQITAARSGYNAEATKLAASARDLAIQHPDYRIFLLSAATLARGYLSRHQPAEAIALLEQSRAGASADGQPLFKNPAAFQATLALPLMKVALLPVMAQAFQAAAREDDALKIWQELHGSAHAAGFLLTEAGAAQEIAAIEVRHRHPAAAIAAYAEAAALWQRTGNPPRQADALTALSAIAFENGEAAKALETSEQVLKLARELRAPRRQFYADLFIAEIAQPRGDMERARQALEEAASLLSPDLTLAEVRPRDVLELFSRLALLYEKDNEPLPRLIALEKALTPAQAIGNLETQRQIAADIGKAIDSLRLRETAEAALGRNDLATALTGFQLIEHYERARARITGNEAAYNNQPANIPLHRVIDIPFQLAELPEGAVTLESNLRHMGPIASTSFFVSLVALAHHYTLRNEPARARQFATEALPFTAPAENPRLMRHDVQVVCELAYAEILLRETAQAAPRAAQCLNLARKFGDPGLLAIAHQLNLRSLEAAGRASEARESSEYLAQRRPANPDYYVEMAGLQAEQKKLNEAAASWREALRLYEHSNQPLRAAFAHLQLAQAISEISAISSDELLHLESALGAYRRLGDAEGQALASAFLGLYHLRHRDQARAQALFDSALRFARASKKPSLEAFVLSNIARRCEQRSNASCALDYSRKSAALYRAARDPEGESSVLQTEFRALENLGRHNEAFEVLRHARRAAGSSGGALNRFWVRRSLARLLFQRGDYAQGLDALRDARAIAVAADQPLNSALASLDLAGGLMTIGDWEAALDAVNFALPIFRRLKSSDDEFAALLTLIEIHSARESNFKDFGKAMGYYKDARSLIGPSDARLASLSMAAGEIEFQQARFKEAIAHASEAFSQYNGANDSQGMAAALVALAEARSASGDAQGAEDGLQRAAALLKGVDDFYLNARYHYVCAGLLRRRQQFQEAIGEYLAVIRRLEQVQSTDSALRRKLSENYGFIYDELAETWRLLGLGQPARRGEAAAAALQYAELNKARVFTSAWRETFIAALNRRLPGRLRERERSLLARQSDLQSELARSLAGEGERKPQKIEDDLSHLAAEIAALQKDLRQASPAYADARYPQPVSVSALPVREGETVIEFKMLDDALLVWIISDPGPGPQIASFYKVSRPRRWFEERILGIRGAFNRAAPDMFEPQAAEELFNAIFPSDVAPGILAARSLIIIPDDVLFLLPFELLSPQAGQSKYLLLKTPTTYFPSAAALRLARAVAPGAQNAGPAWPAQFLAVADPITTADDDRYTAAQAIATAEAIDVKSKEATPQEAPAETAADRDPAASAEAAAPIRGVPPIAKLKSRGYFFERIPETAVEATGIAALFRDVSDLSSDRSVVVRTGIDARKSQLLQTDLDRFRFIHFATHGFLPVEPGVQEPALILSWDGRDESRMMLTLSEIVQLKLRADLVVLSACNTGSGIVTRAEGVSSMGTAFLAAGAGSVTTSLWQVSDQSTSILMQQFYKNLLKGQPKNQALAAARAQLFAQGYTSPFYWAPFILTGE